MFTETESFQPGLRRLLHLRYFDITLAFRWCPPGEFLMGVPDELRLPLRGDTKAHFVRLSQGFWLLETPITKEIGNLVRRGIHRGFLQDFLDRLTSSFPVDESQKNDKNASDQCPAELNQYEADAFCERLNAMVGSQVCHFGTPTQTQWEYACRTGSVGEYGGTGDLNEMGWFDQNSYGHYHEVGTKASNAWDFMICTAISTNGVVNLFPPGFCRRKSQPLIPKMPKSHLSSAADDSTVRTATADRQASTTEYF